MSNAPVNNGRRRFLTAATSVVGGIGVVGVAVPFIGSWNPSARAKAAGAPVEVNIGKIEPGQMIRAEWRGKPVYVIRRTEETLNSLANHEGTFEEQVEGVKDGFFCPCHGSKFDMAGRVFQGVPAPSNLVVPEHSYPNENTILIGVGPGEA